MKLSTLCGGRGRIQLVFASLSSFLLSKTCLANHLTGSRSPAYCHTEPRHNSQTSCSMASSTEFEDRKAASLWGLLIADALAMPVHWYYNPSDIYTGYDGWLTGYRAPNKRHPSSILTLSAIDGSGRNGWHSKSKPVVGGLILHDKVKYWTSRDRSTHYHQGMSAGDNTLNAITALQTMKTMQSVDPDHTMEPRDLRKAIMENYVNFMTTPGSHNDTYAESFHRLFFRDWGALENLPKDGESILKFCEDRYSRVTPSNEDHQIPVIGSMVLAVPWILHYAHLSPEACAANTVEAVKCTHPAPSLEPYVTLYAKMLHAVINGSDLKSEVSKALSSKTLGGPKKLEAIETMVAETQGYAPGSEMALKVYQYGTGRLGSACYIDGAMSSMLLLAYGFHDDFKQGVLTNANCGGENAHRGAALGALLGASSVNNKPIPDMLKEGLHSSQKDIQSLVKHKL